MKRTFVLMLCTALLLSGCRTGKNEEDTSVPEEEIQIGMIFDTFVVERWQRDRDKFVYTANELGAAVDVQNANGEVEKQKEQMEYMIAQGVDVIVVVAIDAGQLTPLVKAARSAGIKVIAYDRMVYNADVDLYISFDNYQVGVLMGETLSENIGEEGKVLMVSGPVSDDNVNHVTEGCKDILEKKGIKIVDTAYIENWRRELAADYLNEHQEYLELADGIMCGNDDLAGEVIKVLSEQRMAGEITVVGQDADLEACQRIVEGTQIMTVYKSVNNLAEEAAKAAVQLAQGEKVDTEDLMGDGTYTVPYLCLQPVKVTDENMEEVIINNGFHSKEDIYMNRPDLIADN